MTVGRLRRPLSHATRLLLLVLLSVTLMGVDHRSHYLQATRSVLALLVYPIQLAALLPERLGSGVVGFFTSKNVLLEENQRLRREELLLRARLQKLKSIEVENARLRSLLGAAARVAERAVVAELVKVSLEPFTQKILVNKGSTDGVYLGQPAIDAKGVIGQITQLTPLTSTATLITDPSHAIPIQVQRNGLRAILFGTGSRRRMDLPHLTSRADIREGDLLVTSAMGGRFPAGYPVAKVTRIKSDPNESFLMITAEPVAGLDYGSEILLIWSETPGPPEIPDGNG